MEPSPYKNKNLVFISRYYLCKYLKESSMNFDPVSIRRVFVTGIVCEDLGSLEKGQKYSFIIVDDEISVAEMPDIHFRLIIPPASFKVVKEHLVQRGEDPRVDALRFLIDHGVSEIVKFPDDEEDNFPSSYFESQFIKPFGQFLPDTDYNFRINSDKCLIVCKSGTKKMIKKYAIIPGEPMLVDISGPTKL